MKKDKIITSKRREKELEQNNKEDLNKKENYYQKIKRKNIKYF